jgi:DNA-binding transcriptional regulator GbsR (MarR family)
MSNTEHILSEEEQSITDCFGSLSQLLRIPVSTGHTYGLLFANPGGLSFSSISGKLSLSKPATSHALRFLTGCGAITKATQGKGHIYKPEVSGLRVAKGFLQSEFTPVINAELAKLKDTANTPQLKHLKKGLRKAQKATKIISTLFVT